MIIGGAQENTLHSCLDAINIYGDDVLLITGPALGPEGSLLDRNPDHGVPVALVDSLRRAIHPTHDWRSYRQVKRMLREFRPDVVHTHSAKGGIIGRFAAHALGVPAIVHTVHGAPLIPGQGGGRQKFYRWAERTAARRCHKLVCVADAMTELMLANRIAPPEKFVTIYSGMDVDPFLHADEQHGVMRERLGFTTEHIVVGKIARLFELKGHEFVVAAARKVIDAQPNVRFLFVGDGNLRESLTREIASAGMTDYFHFAGLGDPSEIPGHVAAMDLLVHTSLREGLARALPQALIAGKPVISYDVDGAREVVIDRETGFLLAPRAIQPLAEAIVKLAADPPLRQQLGTAGQQRFTEQFRHETMSRRLRELYASLLER
jgi:glycosyltransferase involved in cell wall biosynthesis